MALQTKIRATTKFSTRVFLPRGRDRKLLEQQGSTFSRRITESHEVGENHKLPFGLREMFAPLWLRLPRWLSW
jgi:hypothetical protein